MTAEPVRNWDRVGHEAVTLESPSMMDAICIVYSFLYEARDQASLRFTSYQLFCCFNRTMYLELPLGCTASRSGWLLDQNNLDEVWFPVSLAVACRFSPVKDTSVFADSDDEDGEGVGFGLGELEAAALASANPEPGEEPECEQHQRREESEVKKEAPVIKKKKKAPPLKPLGGIVVDLERAALLFQDQLLADIEKTHAERLAKWRSAVAHTFEHHPAVTDGYLPSSQTSSFLQQRTTPEILSMCQALDTEHTGRLSADQCMQLCLDVHNKQLADALSSADTASTFPIVATHTTAVLKENEPLATTLEILARCHVYRTLGYRHLGVTDESTKSLLRLCQLVRRCEHHLTGMDQVVALDQAPAEHAEYVQQFFIDGCESILAKFEKEFGIHPQLLCPPPDFRMGGHPPAKRNRIPLKEPSRGKRRKQFQMPPKFLQFFSAAKRIMIRGLGEESDMLKIGDHFLGSCTALDIRYLHMPHSLCEIGDGWMGGCHLLTKVSFCEASRVVSEAKSQGDTQRRCCNSADLGFVGLTTIGSQFLYRCDGLRSAQFNGLENVQNIGRHFLWVCWKSVPRQVDFRGLRSLEWLHQLLAAPVNSKGLVQFDNALTDFDVEQSNVH